MKKLLLLLTMAIISGQSNMHAAFEAEGTFEDISKIDERMDDRFKSEDKEAKKEAAKQAMREADAELYKLEAERNEKGMSDKEISEYNGNDLALQSLRSRIELTKAIINKATDALILIDEPNNATYKNDLSTVQTTINQSKEKLRELTKKIESGFVPVDNGQGKGTGGPADQGQGSGLEGTVVPDEVLSALERFSSISKELSDFVMVGIEDEIKKSAGTFDEILKINDRIDEAVKSEKDKNAKKEAIKEAMRSADAELYALAAEREKLGKTYEDIKNYNGADPVVQDLQSREELARAIIDKATDALILIDEPTNATYKNDLGKVQGVIDKSINEQIEKGFVIVDVDQALQQGITNFEESLQSIVKYEKKNIKNLNDLSFLDATAQKSVLQAKNDITYNDLVNQYQQYTNTLIAPLTAKVEQRFNDILDALVKNLNALDTTSKTLDLTQAAKIVAFYDTGKISSREVFDQLYRDTFNEENPYSVLKITDWMNADKKVIKDAYDKIKKPTQNEKAAYKDLINNKALIDQRITLLDIVDENVFENKRTDTSTGIYTVKRRLEPFKAKIDALRALLIPEGAIDPFAGQL